MRTSKVFTLFFSGALILSACATPVINKSYFEEGERKVSFAALKQDTEQEKGKLFILGGVIIQTKLLASGSQIEAMDVPVDSSGYFEESGRSEGRYLAVLPKDEGMLDPAVYRRGRRVTLAGEFMEMRKGKIDEMDYDFPMFRIKQLYLWPKERQYYYPPPYYYDPWFAPYPYYYGDPWWDYPHYRHPEPLQPERARTPPPSRAPVQEQGK